MKFENILPLIGFAFVLFAFYLTMTDQSKEVLDQYEKCSICLTNSIEYVYDCQTTYMYGKTYVWWYAIWLAGFVISLVSLLWNAKTVIKR